MAFCASVEISRVARRCVETIRPDAQEKVGAAKKVATAGFAPETLGRSARERNTFGVEIPGHRRRRHRFLIKISYAYEFGATEDNSSWQVKFSVTE